MQASGFEARRKEIEHAAVERALKKAADETARRKRQPEFGAQSVLPKVPKKK
ncbi:hypothetical protein BOX15_Mlig000042g4 [Macrostomum lignano]|uniref:Uncharacterized protein n=1 Tax=Macrostomum lignano TaxID=282301 RepID=A0A267EG24_9PLAT|nr:hypothetical protein BOX15_Mlig000042g2 [Macrostomum lignano]PAA76253.1 hypothetical protein BOX15_Mlig000042g4 [Macrostomum lignano]